MSCKPFMVVKQTRRGGVSVAPRPQRPSMQRDPGALPLRPRCRCACGGDCPRCDNDAAAEHAADVVAAQVMRQPMPTSAPSPAPAAPGAPSTDALDQGGRPLPASLRAFYEPRFGRDFGDVRLHADVQSHVVAAQLQARAFAYGRHVWLGRGEAAAPGMLMAHELAHVVQQSGGSAGVQRTPVPVPAPVPAPAPPTGCGATQAAELDAAVAQAGRWLTTSIAALRGDAGAPADAKHVKTADMLRLHFHRADADLATVVADVFASVLTPLSQGAGARAQCAPATDAACSGGADAAGQPKTGRITFCPAYFGTGAPGQANTVIHEYAHLFAGRRALEDRAYGHHRRYAFLTPEEAFDNAESFSNLAEDLGSGASGQSLATAGLPRDTLTGCDDTKVQRALAKAEGWNFTAFQAVSTPSLLAQKPVQDELTLRFGNALPATVARMVQAYAKVGMALEKPMDVQCHAADDARCTAGLAWSREPAGGALKSDRWHLCKAWPVLADDTARGASFFRGLLERTGGASTADATKMLAFAQTIEPMMLPAPAAIPKPAPAPTP